MDYQRTHHHASLFILIIMFLPAALLGQERFGLTTGNYSGITGARLNPSSIVNYQQYLDIQLAAGGVFLENNYLYIGAQEYRARDVFSLSPQFPTYTEAHPDLGYSVELGAFNHYQNGGDKDLNLDVWAGGPGFLLVSGDYAYGLSINARTAVSLHKVPESVANFAYIGLGYVPQHNIEYYEDGFSAAGMAWMETAFSVAKIFEDRYYTRISGGITLKYLSGASGFYLYGNELDYNMLNRSDLDILNLNATTGMSLPLGYSDNSFPDAGSFFKGRGVAFDIGFTLLQKDKNYYRRDYDRLCQQHYTTYVYRLGISLLDVGFVSFTDNAMAHIYEDGSYYWPNINSYQYEDMNFLMSDLSDRFFRDPGATYNGDKVTVLTPAAISLQGDYSFENNLFLNGTWIHPVVIRQSAIRRPAQVALVPRYERKHFEVAMPLSLYQYKYPRVGLSIRAYALTIGTEKLGAFTGLTDFSGMDIYFSLKLSFDKGNCPGGGRKYGCDNVQFQ